MEPPVKRIVAYCALCGSRYLKEFLGDRLHRCADLDHILKSIPDKDQSSC